MMYTTEESNEYKNLGRLGCYASIITWIDLSRGLVLPSNGMATGFSGPLKGGPIPSIIAVSDVASHYRCGTIKYTLHETVL